MSKGTYKDPNYMEKYRKNNREKLNKYRCEWVLKQDKRKIKNYNLKQYGITVDDLEKND